MKRFVYVLKNESANRYYTGLTSDVRARLAAHNDGHCPVKGRLWRLDVSSNLPTKLEP
jgi:predicted GIY-YIG superfamily endonuclease